MNLSPCTKIQHVEMPATSSDGPTTRQTDVTVKVVPRTQKLTWYNKFSWLKYSVKQDAVFCYVCSHFAVKDNVCEDVLLHGYSDWEHIGNMATKHENSKVHKLSLAKYQGWLQTKESVPVTAKINDQVTRPIIENRETLMCLIRRAIFCARQNIGNCRYNEGCGEETVESQHFNNIGNFQELINLLCLENKSFNSKLNNVCQNAKYTSNLIQNDMLQAASSVITQDIVREIKLGSTVYSFIVDEAHNERLAEQMSICVQYLRNSEIKKQFLGFMELDQLNIRALVNIVNCVLNSVGLELTVSVDHLMVHQ
ncbi:hypothetical protein PR048_003652 [Dryococelus australis]|uniref:TTF-type domain-containing protein n=1 Tax=Dryococelus australis TaxID=614101 RepID=A0ABQ9INS2_9NEOP|nr:hypothetical protein PR048_003652 [Dryococelus australis]